MDLFTLTTVLLIAFGLLGYDTVRHSDVVDLQVVAAPSLIKSDRMTLDEATMDQEFEFGLAHIAQTPSLIPTPLVHTVHDEGIGMTVFDALKMRDVATALQTQVGRRPD